MAGILDRKVALKSATARKDDAIDSDISTAIPPSVANANALLATADTPDNNARAMTAHVAHTARMYCRFIVALHAVVVIRT